MSGDSEIFCLISAYKDIFLVVINGLCTLLKFVVLMEKNSEKVFSVKVFVLFKEVETLQLFQKIKFQI